MKYFKAFIEHLNRHSPCYAIMHGFITGGVIALIFLLLSLLFSCDNATQPTPSYDLTGVWLEYVPPDQWGRPAKFDTLNLVQTGSKLKWRYGQWLNFKYTDTVILVYGDGTRDEITRERVGAVYDTAWIKVITPDSCLLDELFYIPYLDYIQTFPQTYIKRVR